MKSMNCWNGRKKGRGQQILLVQKARFDGNPEQQKAVLHDVSRLSMILPMCRKHHLLKNREVITHTCQCLIHQLKKKTKTLKKSKSHKTLIRQLTTVKCKKSIKKQNCCVLEWICCFIDLRRGCFVLLCHY
jgi:hypothetical protein